MDQAATVADGRRTEPLHLTVRARSPRFRTDPFLRPSATAFVTSATSSTKDRPVTHAYDLGRLTLHRLILEALDRRCLHFSPLTGIAGGAGSYSHSPLTNPLGNPPITGVAGGAGSYNHSPLTAHHSPTHGATRQSPGSPAEPAPTTTHHSPLTTHQPRNRTPEAAPAERVARRHVNSLKNFFVL